MAASNATVRQIIDVLSRHLTQEQIVEIIDALYREVNGNKSVMATIAMLHQYIH